MLVDRRLPSAVTLDPRSSQPAEESSYEFPVLRLPRARGKWNPTRKRGGAADAGRIEALGGDLFTSELVGLDGARAALKSRP